MYGLAFAAFANFVSTKMNVEYFPNYGHMQLHSKAYPHPHAVTKFYCK